MRGTVCAIILCLTLPAFAQDGTVEGENTPPPEESPVPEARPDPEDRLPLAELPNVPDVSSEAAVPAASDNMCFAALDALGVVYEPVPAISDPEDAECGIVQPVRVTEIVPGVALTPAATLRCETAEAMASWVSTHVIPATSVLQERDRGTLDEIALGGSYTCRRRNNLPDGKLSEHSFGNAVDVVSFGFADGAPIPVEPRMDDGTIEEAFQRVARATSCLYFTTVLGPGTDATHENHLHVDIRERNGGFRICQ